MISMVDVASGLMDTTPQAVGVDSCCHYNEPGHARVAEVLEAYLVASREAVPGETVEEAP